MAYDAGSTPTSSMTRRLSTLLVGSMIRPRTRSRNTLSPFVTAPNSRCGYAVHNASQRERICYDMIGNGSEATAAPTPQIQFSLSRRQP